MTLTSCSICLLFWIEYTSTHPRLTCLFANYFSPCFHIKREQNKFKRKVHICLQGGKKKSRFNTIKNYRHAKYSLSNSLWENLLKRTAMRIFSLFAFIRFCEVQILKHISTMFSTPDILWIFINGFGETDFSPRNFREKNEEKLIEYQIGN
jgi:hypothetical protein